MIIKDVQLYRNGEATVLSARCKIRKICWDTIYFSASNAIQADHIHSDASPFAAALLLPSMKQGEDLIIEGNISEQLYKGMHAIMHEVQQWDMGLKPVKIDADALVADTPGPQRSASFFSGGVDSFYTYLKHKTDPVEADRIDCFPCVPFPCRLDVPGRLQVPCRLDVPCRLPPGPAVRPGGMAGSTCRRRRLHRAER